ncbi:MAG: hypothetical protein PWP23_2775 [Candidatus Sumerlaeota bacterium]|nr:hypothetical protein [Candidatus Sumerlaeota bacterium]
MKMPRMLSLSLLCGLISTVWAANQSYDGNVSHDVNRDRILSISEDYSTLYYYVGPDNIDYSSYTGATCPDPTIGWKTGMKYCWGGEDSTAEYLQRMDEGDGAGNKNTSGSSSTDTYCAGADCSGMASNCWTSGRYATSGFSNISDDIDWEDLRMGDCTNDAGSHIRIFDYFVSDIDTIMFYESTSGSGVLWASVHRSLPRDTGYVPIRYNGTYQVIDYPEPIVTYVKRTGEERVEVRWDGEADTGFRLYQSTNGTDWTLVRDTDDLTPPTRYCEVSGLTPDVPLYFKMTSVNTDGETGDSDIVAIQLDGFAPRVLLVDGADRYREQFGVHTFLTTVGSALSAQGAGFDFASNEAVIDEQIDLTSYEAVVWLVAEDSTFDESFAWAEQLHLMNYLENGGRLFVSGSEIGWDLDFKANSSTWKNGHSNDATFYNQFLRADYVADDAATYAATGVASTIFEGLNITFDDGTHGTYDVDYPDVLAPVNGGITGLNYSGGTGGAACVYATSPSAGTIINMGFGFETIYPDSTQRDVLERIFGYFDIPVGAPCLKTATQSAPDAVTLTWEGHASQGFRVYQKQGAAGWSLVADEGTLGPTARQHTITGLSAGTMLSYRVQAINGSEASLDSDVYCVSLGAAAEKVLIVDGYDRWNDQSGGSNHTLVMNLAGALAANAAPFDTCTNESAVAGAVALTDYASIMWMCGEEATEHESFGAAEQALLEGYLKGGGKLFVSGSEIGWDLVEKPGALNPYSNGTANDTPFFQDFLKARYLNDDAETYQGRGVAGTNFEGITFNFDDGTHGTYDANYPDIFGTNGGSLPCLYYGPSGSDIAGIEFTGTFTGGSAESQLVHFGFPIETVYDPAECAELVGAVLDYFSSSAGVSGWIVLGE